MSAREVLLLQCFFPFDVAADGAAQLPPNEVDASGDQSDVIDSSSLLGEAPNDDIVSPDLHPEIVKRLNPIMQNGSDKKGKLEMLNKYPAPANCPMLKGVGLNLEVKATLSKYSSKKDCILELQQRQMGSGIYALGSVLTDLINKKSEDEETKKAIATLCDAGKIFCDCHHAYSISRRSFIVPNLNITAKSVAAESKIDLLLFALTSPKNSRALPLWRRRERRSPTKAARKRAARSRKKVLSPRASTTTESTSLQTPRPFPGKRASQLPREREGNLARHATNALSATARCK